MKVKRMRCCMCPNVNQADPICPGIEHTPHPDPSNCGFVKKFIDNRGWIYKVMSPIGGDTYCAGYLKPGSSSYKRVKVLEVRESFDQAQEDLNGYANKKRWMVYEGERSE